MNRIHETEFLEQRSQAVLENEYYPPLHDFIVLIAPQGSAHQE